MPDHTEYIESYFQQTLNSNEREVFEDRCETEPAFANEVALYVTTRQALRELLLQKKTEEWKGEETAKEETPIIAMAKKTTFGRWLLYAAAACLLLVASMFLFERTTSPRILASNFITKDYSTLSHTMDATQDSMQLGISAYNEKTFDKAALIFNGVTQTDATNSEAKKYAGLSYFQQKEYDEALQQFNALANMKGLFSNAGDYLKAVTLLQRNKPGDKEQAKTLLLKVKNENEEGSSEADELLKKF